MLDTNLKHLETEQEVKEVLKNNENVMVCCGRMGPMCIPVYRIMEELESKYLHVAFRDRILTFLRQTLSKICRNAHLLWDYHSRCISRMEKSLRPRPASKARIK